MEIRVLDDVKNGWEITMMQVMTTGFITYEDYRTYVDMVNVSDSIVEAQAKILAILSNLGGEDNE